MAASIAVATTLRIDPPETGTLSAGAGGSVNRAASRFPAAQIQDWHTNLSHTGARHDGIVRAFCRIAGQFWPVTCLAQPRDVFVSIFQRLFIVLSLAVSVAACNSPTSPTPATPDRTFLSFDSRPGDGIAKGQSRTFDSGNAVIAAVTNRNKVSVEIRELSGTRWHLEMSAPPGSGLVPGTYEVKEPLPPDSPGVPFLSFSGNGLGCIPIGRFTVRAAEYGPGSTVSRFHATFEQRCPSSAEGLSGEVHIVDGGAAPAASVPDIAGTWSGRLEHESYAMSPQVVIQQSGATVTGTWSAANTNWSGTLDGTLTSGGLTGTMTFNGRYPLYQGQQCSGSGPVTAIIEENFQQLVLQARQFQGSCAWMPYSLLFVLQQRR
jgi:hypothetical protein